MKKVDNLPELTGQKKTFLDKDREFGITGKFCKWLAQGRFCKRCCPIRVMSNNLRSTVCLTGTGKVRRVLRRMMVLDWPVKCYFAQYVLVAFGMYVLHTDCHTGTQINK